MKLEEVILRDTRANQPLAANVAAGTIYYVTDESKTERSNGTIWESISDAASGVRIVSIGLIIDGGASVITTGLKGYLEVPFAGTIQAVTLLADVSGSIVVDIWKDIYSNYPPVVADTITAAAKPTITASNKSQNTTLTGWNTAIGVGDILAFNVDSVTAIKKVTLSLKVQVT